MLTHRPENIKRTVGWIRGRVGTVPDERSDILRTWLADVAGPVGAWEQIVAGNSRTTWSAEVDTADGRVGAIVRTEAGDGPFEGTELSLAREAAAYRAVQGRGVSMPRVLGFHPELNAIAMTRLPGSADWAPETLPALLEEVARLHDLDVDDLPLDGFARTALSDLDLWERLAAAKVRVPDPFVDFALAFLRERFPGEPRRLVFCHGDVGPGNFLHEGGRVTGLLDWEFAHVGDPIDDLAWISLRAVLFGLPMPEFGDAVRAHYRPANAVELDDHRLHYWQAMVILRNLITCLASIHNPSRGRDRLVHHMLVPSLHAMLVAALARIAGVTLEPVEPPSGPEDLPGGDVLREVATAVGELANGLTDRDQRSRAKRMRFLLAQLSATWTLAPEIARADAADGPPAADPLERLGQLHRAAQRRLALFPRARAMAEAPVQAFGPEA
jgi:aminoglycoside phosphotransferase (APT) family kinase protein